MFTEFYAAGGIWMHPITLWSLAAAVFMVLQVVKRERNFLLLIWGAFGIALLCGLLGVVVGFIEAFKALVPVQGPAHEQLLRECLAIGFNPLAWALCCVLVLAQFALPMTWWVRNAKRATGV